MFYEQILLCQAYGFPADWWSFGVFVFEMISGQSPFEGDDDEAIFKAAKENKVNFSKHFSNEAKDFCGGVRRFFEGLVLKSNIFFQL